MQVREYPGISHTIATQQELQELISHYRARESRALRENNPKGARRIGWLAWNLENLDSAYGDYAH